MVKIASIDNNCWITLRLFKDNAGYCGFEITSHVDIVHGQFEARNKDVHFLNVDRFLSELDQFVIDRNRAPRLLGTYETYIAFSASGRSVMCAYNLGDAYAGRKTARFYQSGEFEVEQEQLLEILRGLRGLWAEHQRVLSAA